jgi:cardiolipin synthase
MLRHIPNLICVLRMLLTVPTVAAISRGDHGEALGFFVVAALSDGLDGYLAKRNGWTSRLGTILDPLADKLLLVAVFMTCVWQGLVPTWLAVAVIARDLMIIGGAIIYRLWFGAVEGQPTLLSKVNTVLQITVVVAALLAALTGQPPAVFIEALAVATLATTIASGTVYLAVFSRRGWRQLGDPAAD